MIHPVLAIDPGPVQSAWVLYRDGQIIRAEIEENTILLARLRYWKEHPGPVVVLEMIASYGMPVGAEVFETCVWIGRFLQAWAGPSRRVFRRDVKLELCGSMRAKDQNVRQALLDRVGPQGTKKAPGPTYGIHADEWAALGVAVTAEAMLARGELKEDA